MNQKDLHHNVKATTALAPELINADDTFAGVVIDTQGFDSLEFLVTAGALADGVYTAAMAEADEVDEEGAMVDEAVVNAAEGADDLLGSLPVLQNDDGDDSGLTKKVGYKGSKRYVRLDIVSTGTDDGGLIGAVAIQESARNAPVD